MTEQRPIYTTATDSSVELSDGGQVTRAELISVYRSVVSAGLQMQRALGLPPEQCAILEPAARRAATAIDRHRAPD